MPPSAETASTRSPLRYPSFDSTNPLSEPARPYRITRLCCDPQRLDGAHSLRPQGQQRQLGVAPSAQTRQAPKGTPSDAQTEFRQAWGSLHPGVRGVKKKKSKKLNAATLQQTSCCPLILHGSRTLAERLYVIAARRPRRLPAS